MLDIFIAFVVAFILGGDPDTGATGNPQGD